MGGNIPREVGSHTAKNDGPARVGCSNEGLRGTVSVGMSDMKPGANKDFSSGGYKSDRPRIDRADVPEEVPAAENSRGDVKGTGETGEKVAARFPKGQVPSPVGRNRLTIIPHDLERN